MAWRALWQLHYASGFGPTMRNVTDPVAYDVRYGPGHRPRVITKAVGDRGGIGTLGGLGPEEFLTAGNPVAFFLHWCS